MSEVVPSQQDVGTKILFLTWACGHRELEGQQVRPRHMPTACGLLQRRKPLLAWGLCLEHPQLASLSTNSGRSFPWAQPCCPPPDLSVLVLACADKLPGCPHASWNAHGQLPGKDVFPPSRKGECGQLAGRGWASG